MPYVTGNARNINSCSDVTDIRNGTAKKL